MLAVRVPRAGRRPAVVDVDDRHAGLGQSPGQQTALAELSASVAVADRCRFGGELERLADGGRSQQVERPLLVGVERSAPRRTRSIRRRWSSICFEQAAVRAESVRRQRRIGG